MHQVTGDVSFYLVYSADITVDDAVPFAYKGPVTLGIRLVPDLAGSLPYQLRTLSSWSD